VARAGHARQSRARFLISLRALLEGDRAQSLTALERAGDEPADPETKYYVARSLAHLTAHDAALATLREVVDGGYWCYPALAADHWLDGIRGTPAFQAVLSRRP
jgi:hypothetical protein